MRVETSERLLFWLMPAGAARDFFSETIARLAAFYGGPVFPPHLTLAPRRGSSAWPEWPSAPLGLRVAGVHASPSFFKTLFVRFQPNEQLQQLVRALQPAADLAKFDPHVSLLYADLPESEKEELAASLTLPFHEVRFDKVTLMRCPDVAETRAAVESWKEVERQGLAQ